MLKALLLFSILGSLTWTQVAGLDKRDVAIGSSIEAKIIPGTSLTGTSVEGLKTAGYKVQLFGSIENFSRWPMYTKGCKTQTGQISHSMVNVWPGKKEGFASHKTSGSAHGTWAYCQYYMHGRAIHIMWMLPWSRFWYSNYLTIGISKQNQKSTAKQMYKHPPSYAIRKKYRRTDAPLKICAPDFCIKAVLGTSAIAKLTIKVYPTHFAATAPSVQLGMRHLAFPAGVWYDFMRREFGIVYKRVFPRRPVLITGHYRDAQPVVQAVKDHDKL